MHLKSILSTLDITLIDHIIVSGRFFRPVFEGDTSENAFAAPIKFSYGERPHADGVREAEPMAAAGIPYYGNVEQ